MAGKYFYCVFPFFIISCFFEICRTSEIVFLSDDDLSEYKEKVGKFMKNISQTVDNLILENKEKSERIKTEAFNKYKEFVYREIEPFIADYHEADKKQKEAQEDFDKGKDKEKAQRLVEYYSGKIKLIEEMDTELKNLESNIILRLTFMKKYGEKDDI